MFPTAYILYMGMNFIYLCTYSNIQTKGILQLYNPCILPPSRKNLHLVNSKEATENRARLKKIGWSKVKIRIGWFRYEMKHQLRTTRNHFRFEIQSSHKGFTR